VAVAGAAREEADCGVSVVVPAYNYGRYLGEAIDSVLAQTHRHFELLVVDDGSSDNTREIVTAYADPRVRYVWQQNQGLSAARNTGIREARFDFVAFLDADDLWRPDHLAEAMAEFARRGPECALVASNSLRMDQHGTEMATRLPDWKGARRIDVSEIVIRTRFMPSTAVVRRAAFDRCGGFDTGLRSSEDREMWMRIAAEYDVACRSEPTVLIRKHTSNMSKQADRMCQSMRTVIERAQEKGLVRQPALGFWPRVWVLYHFQAAWMYYDEGRAREAVVAALRSIQCWPFPMNAAAINEPIFFRLRALRTFLLSLLRRPSAR
jgi:glycosyltransferase involved in cell wall biosynthesis